MINSTNTLYRASIQTPIGQMVAIANDSVLYLLEFIERKNLQTEVKQLQKVTGTTIIEGKTKPIISIQQELKDYFAGRLTLFKTPIEIFGTPFQKKVWRTLQTIPFGHTWSYAQLASTLGKPTAFRAVANANAKNQHVLMIPCHRVINKNGKLGGYAAGLRHKQWLLQHEQLSRK